LSFVLFSSLVFVFPDVIFVISANSETGHCTVETTRK
jgi:hypothetical protein